MAIENWKAIPGYEGIYEVGDLGHIRRLTAHNNTFSGRILAPGINSKGYASVALYKDGDRKTHSVHILVASAFCVRSEGQYIVNHKRGEKADNRAVRLEWCTPAQNSQHAIRTGIWKPKRGDSHPLSKLNSKKVARIRKRYAAGGITMEALGHRYGVVLGTIWMIIRNRTWVT